MSYTCKKCGEAEVHHQKAYCPPCRDSRLCSVCKDVRVGTKGTCAACRRMQSKARPCSRCGAPKTSSSSYCRKCEQSYKKQRTYGITEERYQEMLSAQGGVCAICKGIDVDRQLAIDHCHHTGNVRGLLCIKCNTAIGKLKDDPQLVRSALDYLVEHKSCASL